MMNSKPFFHELILPFRGNWNIYWVINRYLKTSFSGITLFKLFNVAHVFFEMITHKAKVRSKPFVIRLEPTNICVLHCPRCSCGTNADKRKKGFIDVEKYKELLNENYKNIILIRMDGNGEPTLHPRIFEMIKIAKSYGISVSMSSNLNTLLSADADAIINSGLDRLIVAIDGDTQLSYEKYRVGGNLAQVEKNLINIIKTRKQKGSIKPLIEVQFLDWGYNHNEICKVRDKTRTWDADKFEVIMPDWAVNSTPKKKPKRCFWLWMVLTIDWELNYHSCTNAWTYKWPRTNYKDISVHKFWNSKMMINARKYNINKSVNEISSDFECHCSNCSDMLVVKRPPNYVTE